MLNSQLIIENFVDDSNGLIDCLLVTNNAKGLIIPYVQKEILRKSSRFIKLNSISGIFKASLSQVNFVFIDISKDENIPERVGMELFRYTRGKLKLILYNHKVVPDKTEEFFRFLIWMRIIKI
jgi:hypothetical protein